MNQIVIDVREPEEYRAEHVAGAVNMPSSDYLNTEKRLRDVPKDATIIVYCQSGSRAEAARSMMQGWGYANVINGINQTSVELKYGL